MILQYRICLSVFTSKTAALMEVLVFKTSVKYKEDVEGLAPVLDGLQGIAWSFDLDDPDKILRIETTQNISDKVIEAISLNGFHCEELTD